MNGAAALRALKSEDPDVRALTVSGYREHETLRQVEGSQASGFLPKPFNIDSLLNKVHQGLGI